MTDVWIPSFDLRTTSDVTSEQVAHNVAVRHVASQLGIVEVEEWKTDQGWHWRLRDPEDGTELVASIRAFLSRPACRTNFVLLHLRIGGTKAIRWTKVRAP